MISSLIRHHSFAIRHQIMSNLKYRPEIDGLRAIAVIPVILFHLGYESFSGGFVGVDVFFVISGYLITGIIYKGLAEKNFSFINFWKRRIRRILPALLAVIVFTLVTGYLLIFGGSWVSLGRQSIAALFSVANIEFWRMAGDYWGGAAERSPLLHTWSLSVEEQFYLIYPVIIVLIFKWQPKRLRQVLMLGIAISFTLSCFASAMHPNAGFYVLPFRAWELLCGGYLAIVVSQNKVSFSHYKYASIFSGVGVIVIGLSYITISSEHQFPGPWALLPVIGSLLILAFCGGGDIITKLLTFRPLTYVGKLSYSLYLWHWPVIVFAQYYTQRYQCDSLRQWVIIIVFLSLAIVSYYLVETPCRKSKTKIQWIIGAVVACSIFSLILIKNPRKYDVSYQNPTVWKGAQYEFLSNQNVGQEGHAHTYDGNQPRVMVLGSSHAIMWCGLIDEICSELRVGVFFGAASGTNPFISLPLEAKPERRLSAKEKLFYDSARVEAVQTLAPKVIIIAHPWSGVKKEDAKDLLDLLEDQGCRVLLIEEPPRLAIGDVSAAQFAAYQDSTSQSVSENLYVREDNLENHERGRSLLFSIASERENVDVLPIADLFRNEEKRILVRAGKDILYMDEDHVSEAGARLIRSRLIDYLKPIKDISSQ